MVKPVSKKMERKIWKYTDGVIKTEREKESFMRGKRPKEFKGKNIENKAKKQENMRMDNFKKSAKEVGQCKNLL